MAGSGARAAKTGRTRSPAVPADAAMLLQALDGTHVGLCLCDDGDVIRYANAAFRKTFIPHYRGEPTDFVDALAVAIAAGRGIRLETMPLSTFVPRIKARRRQAGPRVDFSVDCNDGSWWWINDHKMSNGWILVVASDMSTIKHEELSLRHAHAAAVHAASTDFLTGVANRRRGFDEAETAVAALGEGSEPLAIAIIDIDHFKRINDTFGHDIGDKVLVHFAQTLRHQLRVCDQVSRIGGEEFMAVMPGMTVSAGREALARLLGRIPPLVIGPRGSVLAIKASAGVAAARPRASFRDVLAAADMALYAAKAKGRDRVEGCAA